MTTKRVSAAGVALTVIVLCYLGSVAVLRFGSSERAIGSGAAILCALLGLCFLVLASPLGKLLHRARKEVPFMPGPISWPRSSPGWSALLVLAALVLFAIAGVAFYWGTDPASKPALIRWLDNLFR